MNSTLHTSIRYMLLILGLALLQAVWAAPGEVVAIAGRNDSHARSARGPRESQATAAPRMRS